MKYRGGEKLGEGSFGEVHTIDHEFNNVFKAQLLKAVRVTHPIIVTTCQENGTYVDKPPMTVLEFKTKYAEIAVFKKQRWFDIDSNTEVNKEIANLIEFRDAPNSIVLKEGAGVITHFIISGQPLKNIMLKKMHGDLVHLMDTLSFTNNVDVNTIVYQIMSDVSAFLHYIHSKGYYHMDIKPGNIMYKKNDDGRYEFAAGDYGLAGTAGEYLVGTYVYMLPQLVIKIYESNIHEYDYFKRQLKRQLAALYIKGSKTSRFPYLITATGYRWETIRDEHYKNIPDLSNYNYQQLYELCDWYGLHLSIYKLFRASKTMSQGYKDYFIHQIFSPSIPSAAKSNSAQAYSAAATQQQQQERLQQERAAAAAAARQQRGSSSSNKSDCSRIAQRRQRALQQNDCSSNKSD